jgi:MFS family permease
MFSKFKGIYKEYPGPFRVLVLATFIDRLGGFLLFPFFALYITARFNVEMPQVGILFTIVSAGSILGSMIGGALADKIGRKFLIIFGLVVSGIGSIFMGIVNELAAFYILAAILGVLGDFGGSARQAMVVDLLPKNKQAEGFGILRVAVNLSAVIGPILGGAIVTQSYLFLFIADAVSSIITAIIVLIVIPETKPERKDDTPQVSIVKTLIGYKEVLKDFQYIAFLSVSAITVVVYAQLNSTLSVFLRDVHGFAPWKFGFLLATNAIMVVVLQFWITRKVSKYAPMKVMAVGTLLYMVGFGMYGFISSEFLFFVAMIILTMGEMIEMPIGQSVAARFATEDKRGRYMAFFGFHWAIPNLFAVFLAGIVMVTIGPNWVWYFAGILSFIAVVGFWILNSVTKKRFVKIKKDTDKELNVNLTS